MRHEQLFQNGFHGGVFADVQNPVTERSGFGNFVRKENQLLLAAVIPEPGVIRMKIGAFKNKGKRLGLVFGMPGTSLLDPPLLAVAWRHEDVVILHEFAERDQDLPYVEDVLHLIIVFVGVR